MVLEQLILAGLLVLALLWLWGAWLGGLFIIDRDRAAADPGDPGASGFSGHKQLLDLGDRTIALLDEGRGDPAILLHGCPFSAYEWRKIIPVLVAAGHRVIAPDLLGLGDTPVSLRDDYRLPRDVDMVIALMDRLGIDQARFVGHDHGAATLQLLMSRRPQRIQSAVLTNAEAYDQWPSEPERPYLRLAVNPLTSPFFRLALALRPVRREVFSIAYHDPDHSMHDEDIDVYTRTHIATARRFARFRRFFRWQLDRRHNRITMQAVPGLRRFKKPVLILWGQQDSNFGPAIAERLAADIPGATGVKWMHHSAHMPMEEEPEAYAAALLDFWRSTAAQQECQDQDPEGAMICPK